MRAISLTVFIAGILTAAAAIAEDYSVRNIDPKSEKFDRIYQAVAEAKQKADTPAGEKRSVEIRQHIEGNRYLVYLGPTYAQPGSMARAMNQLAGRSTGMVKVKDGQACVMDIPSEQPLADETKFSKTVIITKNTYQYVDVLGAKRTVSIAETPEVPDRMTKEQLIVALQNGETFDIPTGTKELRCKFCNGFGKVADRSNVRRSPDGKVKCSKCRGVGKAQVPVMTRIIW